MPKRLEYDCAALREMIDRAIAAFEALPEEEKKKHRRAQAISFVHGNLSLSGRTISLEEVARVYDIKHKDNA